MRYIGHTSDVRKRVHEHNCGKCRHLAKHRPWKLRLYVAFETLGLARSFERYLNSARTTYSRSGICGREASRRLSAVRRERQLKGWSRKKKEALIRGDLDGLHALAKRRNQPTASNATSSPAPAGLRAGMRIIQSTRVGISGVSRAAPSRGADGSGT
jgi:predicted GIY-YIG superfamily endonuclease